MPHRKKLPMTPRRNIATTYYRDGLDSTTSQRCDTTPSISPVATLNMPYSAEGMPHLHRSPPALSHTSPPVYMPAFRRKNTSPHDFMRESSYSETDMQSDASLYSPPSSRPSSRLGSPPLSAAKVCHCSQIIESRDSQSCMAVSGQASSVSPFCNHALVPPSLVVLHVHIWEISFSHPLPTLISYNSPMDMLVPSAISS